MQKKSWPKNAKEIIDKECEGNHGLRRGSKSWAKSEKEILDLD